MENCISLPLSDSDLKDLVPKSKDYAYSHGVLMRSKIDPLSPDSIIHAPFTLLPSPVPHHCYAQAKSVQVDFNVLMYRIASDTEFLESCVRNVIKVDEFTRHIWNIYETIEKEKIKKPIFLAMNRSDYMFDYNPPSSSSRESTNSGGSTSSRCDVRVNLSDVKLRQIEFNTISVSFPGLSQQLQSYHTFILNQLGCPEKNARVPSNEAATGLARGMVEAWKQYSNPQAVVLFLTYTVERNIYDQRWLEYAIINLDSQIKVIRHSIKDVYSKGHLNEANKLIVDGHEVAIVYQRSCYVPADFTDESDWETLLMMERSCAIMCPTVGYHLAGTKKVQQELARPGVLERFISDEASIQRIRDTFAGQFSLDMNAEGDANAEMAIKEPDRFVLKPQREGGGNNTFGEEVRTLLTKLRSSEERSSYVLMERIQPIVVQNYPIVSHSDSPVELTDMVSELGIYGVLVATDAGVVVNSVCGHLLRTKKLGTDEGGVATGYSVLDSPYLVDK